MFKEVGFVSDGPSPPEKDQKLFRGAPLPKGDRGMSWTPVREIAEGFAVGIVKWFGKPAALYSAVIPHPAISTYVGFDGNPQENARQSSIPTCCGAASSSPALSNQT